MKRFGAVFIRATTVLLFVLCTGRMVFIFCRYKSEDLANKALEHQCVRFVQTVESTREEVACEPEYPQLEVDMQKLQTINRDVIGWLYYDLFDISYPIVQGEDNKEYIHTSFEGKNTSAGTIFLDCENQADFSDWHSILYGHDRKDGSMFGKLKDIHGKTDVNEQPCFYIYTEKAVFQYRVFSYMIVSPEDSMYNSIHSEEEYESFFVRACELSQMERKADIPERAKVVSLSTCYRHSRRTLVHGYLEKEYHLE